MVSSSCPLCNSENWLTLSGPCPQWLYEDLEVQVHRILTVGCEVAPLPRSLTSSLPTHSSISHYGGAQTQHTWTPRPQPGHHPYPMLDTVIRYTSLMRSLIFSEHLINFSWGIMEGAGVTSKPACPYVALGKLSNSLSLGSTSP